MLKAPWRAVYESKEASILHQLSTSNPEPEKRKTQSFETSPQSPGLDPRNAWLPTVQGKGPLTRVSKDRICVLYEAAYKFF